MAEIYLKKHYGTLAPADERAEEIIANMRHGQVVKVDYHFPRNYENHKRFFAFLKVTFDIQNHFDNMEHYRKWLQIKAGYWESVIVPQGKRPMFLPKSIAFDKMEEIEFKQLFSNCIDTFIQHWGDRITKDELESVIQFS